MHNIRKLIDLVDGPLGPNATVSKPKIPGNTPGGDRVKRPAIPKAPLTKSRQKR